MVEMLIVKNKIKSIAKGCNVAGDFAEGLNEIAIAEVKKAMTRADSNGRKTIQKRDVYMGDTTTQEMLVVKSKIKDIANDCNVAGDFAEGLNELLVMRVVQAVARAESNGRKTIGNRDL